MTEYKVSGVLFTDIEYILIASQVSGLVVSGNSLI